MWFWSFEDDAEDLWYFLSRYALYLKCTVNPRANAVRPCKNMNDFQFLLVGERIVLPLFKSAQSSVFRGMAPSPRELSSECETEGVLELPHNSFHRRSAVPLPQRGRQIRGRIALFNKKTRLGVAPAVHDINQYKISPTIFASCFNGVSKTLTRILTNSEAI